MKWFIGTNNLILLAFIHQNTKVEMIINKVLMKSNKLCICLKSMTHQTVMLNFELHGKIVL